MAKKCKIQTLVVENGENFGFFLFPFMKIDPSAIFSAPLPPFAMLFKAEWPVFIPKQH